MAFHETIPADEAATFERYGAEIRAMQAARAARAGKTVRALHVKQHIGTVGEIVVTAPEALRAGAFAEPGKRWPVYVRFSNGSGGRQADRTQDARGIALKLVGVPGKKVIPGLEDKVTQDFLLIAEPAIAFKNAAEFMYFVRAAKDGPLKLLPRVLGSFGFGRGLQVLRRLSKIPQVTSMADRPFYTAAPIAWGATAAKVSIVPLDVGAAPSVGGEHMLRDDLVARLRAGPLRWSVRAQLFVDDATTPIEDTSVEWPEARSPYVEVGQLTIAKQDPESPEGRNLSDHVDAFSFDPWHALEAHRPLGDVMRARAVAYRESVLGRKAAEEPTSVVSLAT